MIRRAGLVVAALAVLAFVQFGIMARERVLHDGRTLVLAVAPVDPRALLQGDYLRLAWRATRDAFPSRALDGEPADGFLIVGVDAHGVGTFRRRDDGTPLAADEMRLRYRIRDGEVRLATNAWFFQEGTGAAYAGAQFGEFRVAGDGEMILVALRDAKLGVLGRPLEGVDVVATR